MKGLLAPCVLWSLGQPCEAEGAMGSYSHQALGFALGKAGAKLTLSKLRENTQGTMAFV